MTIFTAVLLTVLTFAFIIYPLLRQRAPKVGLAEDEKLQELRSKRDTTYSMLKEMEFDLQSGILTEEDYHDLEARYKRKAISILKDIDDLNAGTNTEDDIEKRILELRQNKGRFCSQCGAKYRESDRFCSRCGTSLRQGGHVD
ncbi:MAG: hypothetical protein CL873_01445 [Dehalococcoidales bacterium]|jgi:hypothetical protein|nr:hypothetical protein [Dehalococcoidales bacterium]|tara:strand:- start:56 stop:484 length:429 start_codon:yes stop_codon:yes gene_type:complete